MDLLTLQARCRELDIEFKAVGDTLWASPDDRIDDALADAIAKHKAVLLQLYADTRSPAEELLAEANRLWPDASFVLIDEPHDEADEPPEARRWRTKAGVIKRRCKRQGLPTIEDRDVRCVSLLGLRFGKPYPPTPPYP